MANKPNMGFKGGYNSSDADSMLSELYPAMAQATKTGLGNVKTGLGNVWNSMDNTSKAATVVGLVPGIGQVGDLAGLADDARLFYQNPQMRTPANFGLSALGALPLMPSMGMVKGMGKGMDVPAINDIRPPKENLSTVTSSLSNNAKVIGDETVNIDSLQGGVGQEVNDIKRVDDLAKKLSTKGSYIERLIVDDAGNVIEGQHRLDALRKLGVKEVPIVRIKDYMRDFPNDVKDTIRSAQKMPSDQVNQLESMLAEIYAQENGNISEIMKYDVPKGYEDAWSAAINVLKRNDMTAQESKGLVPPKYYGNNDNTYYRRSKSESGSNDVPWQMFAKNKDDIDNAYSGNLFLADNRVGKVVNSDSIIDAINDALSKNYEILDTYQANASDLAQEASPSRIVDSAGLWDSPDITQYIYDEVLAPLGIQAVETPDGLIVFDPDLVKMAEKQKPAKKNIVPPVKK